MSKSPRVTFRPERIAEGDWQIQAHYPDVDIRYIPGFKSKAEIDEWLNGDGSLAFIEHTVTTGVPQPKSHPAPMPPMGGASLSPEQIKAVAAYVYSLSHKG